MAQIRASRTVNSAIWALESWPALAAASTSSMALPINAKRSPTVEHMCETIE